MFRIDSDGNLNNRFVDNPVPGQNATVVSADWLNSVQEEIISVIEGAGITLDKQTENQLLQAIPALITPSSILTKLKTVDGENSELDTDLVRGTTPGVGGLALLALSVLGSNWTTFLSQAKPTTIDGFGITDAVHPGMMIPFAGSTAPTGWLLCIGQIVSRSTYSNLFDVIGTTYGAGDGSTTFQLPDMRELVPVGVGTNAKHSIAAHDAFTLGQFKDDQMQGHWHAGPTGVGGVGQNWNDSFGATNLTAGALAGNPVSDGSNGTPRTGSVTRGKRIGVNYLIKT